MRVGEGQRRGHQPGILVATKISVPSPITGDHGQAVEHRLRQRQTKPFAPGWGNVSIAAAVEGCQLLVAPIIFVDDHLGAIGKGCLECSNLLLNIIVGIGEGLNDQTHTGFAPKRFAERSQNDIGCLAGETR